MQVFSKLAHKKETTLSWHDFFDKNIQLNAYKVPELKNIAKQHRLHVSGTKPILILRISSYFHKMKHVTKIQTCFRKYLVRLFFRLRGKQNNQITYVNNTDFYTMEPVDKIPFHNLYCYEDNQGFFYAFDLTSLESLFHNTNGVITNPYNREKINIEVFNRIFKLIRLNKILFKHRLTNSPENGGTQSSNRRIDVYNGPMQSFENHRVATFSKLNQIRQLDVFQRIEETFIEIDFLGNYTQSTWFSSLNSFEYMRFAQILYDIWEHRSNMSFVTRRRICPFFNPFFFGMNEHGHALTSMDLYRNQATTIVENIVFSGGDAEFRKIGVMHILTALTAVSEEARIAIPWLYESLV